MGIFGWLEQQKKRAVAKRSQWDARIVGIEWLMLQAAQNGEPVTVGEHPYRSGYGSNVILAALRGMDEFAASRHIAAMNQRVMRMTQVRRILTATGILPDDESGRERMQRVVDTGDWESLEEKGAYHLTDGGWELARSEAIGPDPTDGNLGSDGRVERTQATSQPAGTHRVSLAGPTRPVPSSS